MGVLNNVPLHFVTDTFSCVTSIILLDGCNVANNGWLVVNATQKYSYLKTAEIETNFTAVKTLEISIFCCMAFLYTMY